MRAIGLMSGTSMDGIDVALLETDGGSHLAFGPTGSVPYGETDRVLLRRALEAATGLDDRTARPAAIDEAERQVTALHAAAVETFLADHDIDRASIGIIGFHGQTILHRPERRLTVQIGDGARLAAKLGVPVIADMRAADVAAGGQGAPIVPVFHQALALAAALPMPALMINIGGVANVSLVTGEGDPVACDTGPGNALLDDLMLERTGVAYDRDGQAAQAGAVDDAALSLLMRHPYFAAPLPKSLDRNAFSHAPVADLSTAIAAATLTAFTAASIVRGLDHLPARPRVAVVCGGGARNPALMAALAGALPCELLAAESLGWQPDFIEAQAFAYLAVRSLHGMPLTFPSTTGVPRPLTGGVLFVPPAKAA